MRRGSLGCDARSSGRGARGPEGGEAGALGQGADQLAHVALRARIVQPQRQGGGGQARPPRRSGTGRGGWSTPRRPARSGRGRARRAGRPASRPRRSRGRRRSRRRPGRTGRDARGARPIVRSKAAMPWPAQRKPANDRIEGDQPQAVGRDEEPGERRRRDAEGAEDQDGPRADPVHRVAPEPGRGDAHRGHADAVGGHHQEAGVEVRQHVVGEEAGRDAHRRVPGEEIAEERPDAPVARARAGAFARRTRRARRERGARAGAASAPRWPRRPGRRRR